MIKYFDTEAAYAASSASTDESDVSYVEESSAVKVDRRNVVVGARYAKTGDIVVLDSDNAMHFVDLASFSSSTFPTDEYTVVGVVAIGVDHPDYRGKLAIVHKTNASKQWSAIYSFRLTGYTLDGESHTGILKVRDASNWGTPVDYTITYAASTVTELAAVLNTYFRANAPFTTQHWRAEVNDGAIDLKFLFTDYRQASNSAGSGFSVSANLLPGIPASSSMLRYSGQRSGEGAISNWDRAIAYYRNDNGSSAYQGGRTSDQGSNVKQTYPINLPTWLGTSTQNPGDFCAGLRAIYGQGEAGWLKFMKTCLPVRPTSYSVMGDKATYGDGAKNTALMAGQTFTKQDNTTIPAFPAADYCGSVVYNHELLKTGCWQLPDADTLAGILSTIKYNAVNDREADLVNKALYAIGGSAINNGSGIWASSRCGAGSAWYSVGSYGYWGGNYMYGTNLAVPVALLDVSDSEL